MSSSDDRDASSASETTIGDRGIERTAKKCLDGLALKPKEVSLDRAVDLPFDRLTIDYEGTEHVPDAATLKALAKGRELRVTVPVRADGFDPLGDHSLLEDLSSELRTVLIAGHPAYLSREERRRPIAPRFRAAMDSVEDPWVGTEGVERIALATGMTQFELLSNTTPGDIRSLRAAGFDGTIAVYAPTILTDDPDAILDAIGAYVGRRKRVAERLPEGTPTDSTATGDARQILLEAASSYAIVGSASTVQERVEELREAGADEVIGYPARGLDEFLS